MQEKTESGRISRPGGAAWLSPGRGVVLSWCGHLKHYVAEFLTLLLVHMGMAGGCRCYLTYSAGVAVSSSVSIRDIRRHFPRRDAFALLAFHPVCRWRSGVFLVLSKPVIGSPATGEWQPAR